MSVRRLWRSGTRAYSRTRTAKTRLFLDGGRAGGGLRWARIKRTSSRFFLQLHLWNSSRRLNFSPRPFFVCRGNKDVHEEQRDEGCIVVVRVRLSTWACSPTFLFSSKACLAWVALMAWYAFLFLRRFSGTNLMTLFVLKETIRCKQSCYISVNLYKTQVNIIPMCGEKTPNLTHSVLQNTSTSRTHTPQPVCSHIDKAVD